MQLNLTTDYALRALLVLHIKGEQMSSLEIKEQIGIEREFTQKILRQLRKAGFVKATKGKMGGYTLAKPLSEISLWDVFVVMEDSMYVNKCLEPDHFCSRDGVVAGCQVHNFYEQMQERMYRYLSNISLQDVVDEKYELM